MNNLRSNNKRPLKLNLCLREAQIDILNDPIFKLLINFSEIEIIMKSKEDIFKILYLIFEKVQTILYDSENIIKLEFISDKFCLFNYFYLSLLLTYNDSLINFNYLIDIIKAINNQKIENENILKIKLKSKIVLDLINN